MNGRLQVIKTTEFDVSLGKFRRNSPLLDECGIISGRDGGTSALNSSDPFKLSYNAVRFLQSAETLAQCPPDQGCEIAFAGRSNAGKSSALNTITGHTKLARTSKTPGRTQLLNFFSLHHPDCRLVDLPGYGYAKVSKEQQRTWQQHLNQYLEHRQSLQGLVLVMDIRNPMTEFDLMMLNWAEASQLPVLVLLTKADKLSFGQAKSQLLKLQRQFGSTDGRVQLILFSALKKMGVDEARERLDRMFESGLAEAGNPPSQEITE